MSMSNNNENNEMNEELEQQVPNTIAGKFIEFGRSLGIDMEYCNSGNIADVLHYITENMHGEVPDNQNISTAMTYFLNRLLGGGPGPMGPAPENPSGDAPGPVVY